jgi:hypothetical protein
MGVAAMGQDCNYQLDSTKIREKKGVKNYNKLTYAAFTMNGISGNAGKLPLKAAMPIP